MTNDMTLLEKLNCKIRKRPRKAEIYKNYILDMLTRTNRIFEYKGLPDTIPAEYLEIYIQVNGVAGVTEYRDNLYAYGGGLGGAPNEYYQPTVFTIANPAQNFSKNLHIGTECEIIRNDILMRGLMPIHSLYAAQLTDALLTMQVALVNHRAAFVISAADDRTAESARLFMKKLDDGELSIITEPALIESLKITPTASGTSVRITETLEMYQYILSRWYNDIGLQSGYNMKRAQLSADEVDINTDQLHPLIDEMLNERKLGVERINKHYGTNISVDFAGVWRDRHNDDGSADATETEETEETEDKGGRRK